MDTRHLLFLRIFMAVNLLLPFTSCGSKANFNSGGSTRPTANGTAKTGYYGQKVDKLTWFWQCDSAPAPPPETAGGSVVVSGAGDHNFKSASFNKTPLIFSGKVCPPVTYPRDIIFVIDVSGSMTGADPIANGSCGRLKAVETIINDIVSRGGDTRFGIVTFSSGLVARSSMLFGDRTNLFADVARGSTISDTICRASGGTNYGSALSGAESIFTGSRAQAIKELYFVSDGAPEDTAGPALASRMKNPGISIGGKAIPVTIATAMLGAGDDSVLKKDIASKDNSGVALHVGSVAASQLATTLSKLAANEILDSVMKYRAVGTEAWTEINLTASIIDYSFSVPSITIDKSVAPEGLEVHFEYLDQHNNKYISEGKILWQASTPQQNTPATK